MRFKIPSSVVFSVNLNRAPLPWPCKFKEFKLVYFKASNETEPQRKKWVWGMFSPLRKCGICRLRVEQLSDKPTALVAFCRIPDNEHRLCLWRSASFPLFALASQVAQLPHYQFSFLRDTLFLLLTACLYCWWWLKFTFLSVPHKVITTLLQINADFTVSNHNKAAFRCSDSLTIPGKQGGCCFQVNVCWCFESQPWEDAVWPAWPNGECRL